MWFFLRHHSGYDVFEKPQGGAWENKKLHGWEFFDFMHTADIFTIKKVYARFFY